jgi:hypothetical protein
VFGITGKRRGFYQAGGAVKVMGKGGDRREVLFVVPTHNGCIVLKYLVGVICVVAVAI